MFNVLLYACMHILIASNSWSVRPEMGFVPLKGGNISFSMAIQDTPMWDFFTQRSDSDAGIFPSQSPDFTAPLMRFPSLRSIYEPDSAVGITPS